MKLRTDVRIPCRSHADVIELALRLEADGYSVARRRRAVIACTETRKGGEELARKLQLEAVVVSTVQLENASALGGRARRRPQARLDRTPGR